jgi:hypothetical protein
VPEGAYTVGLVVDPEFGARLGAQAARMPVWIADTPANRAAAAALRREAPASVPHTAAGAVTTFRVASEESPAEWALRALGDVDLHHGQYSHAPPYGALEVVGAEPTPDLRAALAEYGLTEIEPRPGGFLASRPRVA